MFSILGKIEKEVILIERPLGNLWQDRPKLSGSLLVTDGLQSPRLRLALEDTFHRFAIVRMIAAGMAKGQVDVVAVILLFLPENMASMETSVFLVAILQAEEELFGMIAEGLELIADRFQAIAYCFATVDSFAIEPDSGNGRQPFMADKQIKFR